MERWFGGKIAKLIKKGLNGKFYFLLQTKFVYSFQTSCYSVKSKQEEEISTTVYATEYKDVDIT